MPITVDDRTSGKPGIDGAICIVHRMLGFHEMRICLSAMQRPIGERWIDVNVEGTGVAHQRNAAVRTALQAGAKRIIFIDDDHVFAPNALMRLIERDVPVIGGLYLTRKPNYFLTAMRKNAHDTRYTSLDPSEINGPDLVEVDGLGMGFTLIKREVFEAIAIADKHIAAEKARLDEMPLTRVQYNTELALARARANTAWMSGERCTAEDIEKAQWFEMGYFGRDGQDEDFCFCDKAQKAGFKIYADPTLRIPHLAIKAIVPSDNGEVILTEPKQAVQIAMAYQPGQVQPASASAPSVQMQQPAPEPVGA